jgi:hypothetical protein
MAGSTVDRRMLDTNDAASMLGMTPGALRQAARQGRVPSRRFGRLVVYLADELSAWMADLPRQAPRPAPAGASYKRHRLVNAGVARPTPYRPVDRARCCCVWGEGV